MAAAGGNNRDSIIAFHANCPDDDRGINYQEYLSSMVVYCSAAAADKQNNPGKSQY